MVVDVDGPEHLTGHRGPWEYFASGSALGRMGREAAAVGRFASGAERAGSLDAITGVHVAEALPIGNPLLRPLTGRIDLRNHRKIVVIDGNIT